MSAGELLPMCRVANRKSMPSKLNHEATRLVASASQLLRITVQLLRINVKKQPISKLFNI